MKNYIIITTTKMVRGSKIPATDTPTETRLYEMSDVQKKLYERAVRGLMASSPLPLQAAQKAVEDVVIKLIRGGKVPPGAPAIMHEMALSFREVTNVEIEAMPVSGCPAGPVEAIVLPIAKAIDGDGSIRVVRIDFTSRQRAWYNSSMVLLERQGMSRDQAWLKLNRAVGQLLAGAELSEEASDVLKAGRKRFPTLCIEEVDALPTATEDDVVRLGYRDHREPEYVLLDTFKSTTRDDPKRGVWYSAHPDRCGFWTDDWSTLTKIGSGIPACPHCKCVGMQTTFEDWIRGVRDHQEKGNEFYVAFVEWHRDRCSRNVDGTWGERYEEFRSEFDAPPSS